MSTYTRISSIAVVLAVFISGQAIAVDPVKRAEFEASKACSEQCTDKFGSSDRKQKKKYDRAGREDCMSQCMAEPQERAKKAKAARIRTP
jgi:hypothetical protein